MRRTSALSVPLAAGVLLVVSACGASTTATSTSATSTSVTSTSVTSTSATSTTSPAAPSTTSTSATSTSAPSTSATSVPAASSGATGSAPAGSSDATPSAGPASSGTTSSGTAPSGIASAGASSAAAGSVCTPDQVKTKNSGKLVIATDDPAYEPWMVDNDPTNGKGYESAVAYAVAAELGFTKSQVSWTRAKFNAAISPAPKDYDFDINQFSISEDRRKAVDFSTGYYDVTQAVVTLKTSPIAKDTTLAQLKTAKLGAQIGTTSLTALKTVIAPDSNPTVFQTNDTAVQALKSGQIDGLVLDLPTAFYEANADLDGGVLLGQLPSSSGAQEQFGLLLEKGSALTACASKAVDALRADGTLASLTGTWLTKQGAPVLK